MGLLDNLFKPKPETAAKKIGESAEPVVESGAGKVEEASGSASKPGGFLSPKTYVPRAAVQVVPPTRAHPPAERKPAPAAAEASGPKIILLTLGDVLARIPAHFLRPGEHDAKRELRFKMDELSADLARGRAAVDLKRIVAQCPDVFVADAGVVDDLQVRLPLQKLVEQIGLGPLPRPALPLERPVFEAAPEMPAPVVAAHEASLAAAEAAALRLPAAEAAALRLPAAGAAALHPTPTVAQAPRLPPAVAAGAPPAGSGTGEASPEPILDREPAAPPALDFTPEANASEPAVREEKIHLGLAAILQRCPPEILVGALPEVSETVRITFPFPPIERQLASGKVEVSSLRFIAALPPGLMKHFEAREGVKVPLPLEEIFQNLPGLTAPTAPVAALEMIPPPVIEEVAAKAPEAPPPSAPEPEVELLAEEVTPVPPSIEAATPPPVEEVAAMVTKAPDEPPESAPATELPAVGEDSGPGILPVAVSSVPDRLEARPTSGAPSANEPAVSLTPLAAAPPAPSSVEPPLIAPTEPGPWRAVLPSLRPPILLTPAPVPLTTPPIASTLPAPERPKTTPAAAAISPPAITPTVPAALAPPVAFQPPPEFAPEQKADAAPPEPVLPPAMPLQPPPIAEENTLPLQPAPGAEEKPAASVTPEAPAPILPGRIPRIGPPLVRPVVVMPPRIFINPTAVAGEAALPPAGEPAPVIANAVADDGSVPLAAAIPPPLPAPIHEPAVPASAPTAAPEPVRETIPPPPALVFDGVLTALFPSAPIRDLAHLGELLSRLPGMQACVLAVRDESAHGGELPAGLDPQSLRELGQHMHGALSANAHRLSAGEVQHLTLHGERFSLSLFTRGAACIGAVHRARIFLPGVREKFASVAEELARQTA